MRWLKKGMKARKVMAGIIVAAAVACGVMVMAGTADTEREAGGVSAKAAEVVKMQVREQMPTSSSIMRRGHIVFYTQQGCIFCRNAMAFIKKEYPGLVMEVVDVGSDEGYKKFVDTARRFRVRDVGTPFITLGDAEYLMGWSGEEEARFRRYVQTLPKTHTY